MLSFQEIKMPEYSELNISKVIPRPFKVFYDNGVELGDIYQEVDGYFVFLPQLRGGFWSEEILIQIGEKLKSLNKDWDDHITKYFEEHQ